jgi:hypothetical protein
MLKIDQYCLRNLPPFGKVFVGIFATLMLLVCLWSMVIYIVQQGMVTSEDPLAYMKDPSAREIQYDIEAILADSNSVLAPIWDSMFAGREAMVDSASMAFFMAHADSVLRAQRDDSVFFAEQGYVRGSTEHLRHNIGLAHTHINGQTLLYFAIGLVFLFTSVLPRTKKIVYWIFGAAIVAHAVGLSGRWFCSFYDDILAISGVILLLLMVYMALMIFMDLARKPVAASE